MSWTSWRLVEDEAVRAPEVELVQGLADGRTLNDLSRDRGNMRVTMNVLAHRLRKKHRVKTNGQLIAHYLRNGWID